MEVLSGSVGRFVFDNWRIEGNDICCAYVQGSRRRYNEMMMSGDDFIVRDHHARPFTDSPYVECAFARKVQSTVRDDHDDTSLFSLGG